MTVSGIADLILHNGRIATLDVSGSETEAVAVWRGRILATGKTSDILGLAGPRTRRIDLAGRRVVPGIVDSHCHPDSHAISLLRWNYAGFPTVKSVADLLALVQGKARSLPAGEPLLCFGYNDQKSGGYPSRRQLDEAAGDRPVWIYRTDHHIAIVNSAMLTAMRVPEGVNNPPHGQFDRDPATGKLTGLMREMAAWSLEERFKDSYRVEEYEEGLQQVFKLYLQHGVTSLHNSLTAGKAIQAYQRLRDAGKLAMRIGVIVDGRDEALVDSYIAAGIKTGFGDDWIRIIGVEWCPDCSTSGRTAAYYDPYVGTPIPGEPVPNRGMLLYEPEELFPKVARVHRAGLRVCVEGLGDRGIDFALDAIEQALDGDAASDHRSRIEHCCYVTPPILERIKKLRVIDSSATGFMYSLGDAYIANRGEPAMRWMFPHRTLIDAGVPAPGHSDAPVCGTNPWEIIGTLVTRRTDTGKAMGPEEAIDLTEALRAYTTLGAYAGFEENAKGSIEPGKLADMAVLATDPYAGPPEAIKDTAVAMTILDGEIRFEA